MFTTVVCLLVASVTLGFSRVAAAGQTSPVPQDPPIRFSYEQLDKIVDSHGQEKYSGLNKSELWCVATLSELKATYLRGYVHAFTPCEDPEGQRRQELAMSAGAPAKEPGSLGEPTTAKGWATAVAMSVDCYCGGAIASQARAAFEAGWARLESERRAAQSPADEALLRTVVESRFDEMAAFSEADWHRLDEIDTRIFMASGAEPQVDLSPLEDARSKQNKVRAQRPGLMECVTAQSLLQTTLPPFRAERVQRLINVCPLEDALWGISHAKGAWMAADAQLANAVSTLTGASRSSSSSRSSLGCLALTAFAVGMGAYGAPTTAPPVRMVYPMNASEFQTQLVDTLNGLSRTLYDLGQPQRQEERARRQQQLQTDLERCQRMRR